MSILEMNRIVNDDLARIPDGPGLNQSVLRASYAARRKRNLGKSGDRTKGPREVMRDAIVSTRKNDPSALLLYDHEYFGEQS